MPDKYRQRSRRWLTMRQREAIDGYICALPGILGLLIFTIGPIIASFYISFTRWDMLRTPKWRGLYNYTRLLTNDPLFWQSLKVTAIYAAVTVPLALVLSLAVAVLMNQKVKGISVFRTIYYLPSVVTGVSVSILWIWIFSPEFGLFNWFLSLFGIKGPAWLADPFWALPALMIMAMWGIGGGMIVYLAGLQSIPTQLYEAAQIDGATAWQRFRKITIPMLSPVIFFNLIMGIIGSFQVFTQGYVMTSGGPANATLFYVLYLYYKAFQDLRMGYAAAMAWILFVIVLALTLVVFKTSGKWVYYEGQLRGGK